LVVYFNKSPGKEQAFLLSLVIHNSEQCKCWCSLSQYHSCQFK